MMTAGRLKVNMGNIYFKQKSYAKAIKYYRMALDQVPNHHRIMRLVLDYFFNHQYFVFASKLG